MAFTMTFIYTRVQNIIYIYIFIYIERDILALSSQVIDSLTLKM